MENVSNGNYLYILKSGNIKAMVYFFCKILKKEINLKIWWKMRTFFALL
jgi:hypothetical protein